MTNLPKLNKARRREIINIIRTTQRNNIELTHIADNKANVLLSLNALMITFLLPLILANFQIVTDLHLILPVFMLLMTSMITIYLSALVLKPGEFDTFRQANQKEGKSSSPFFFGNFYDMEHNEFIAYMSKALESDDDVKRYLADDLYYIGNRLGSKMTKIKLAFNIFLLGLTISLVSTVIILLIN